MELVQYHHPPTRPSLDQSRLGCLPLVPYMARASSASPTTRAISHKHEARTSTWRQGSPAIPAHPHFHFSVYVLRDGHFHPPAYVIPSLPVISLNSVRTPTFERPGPPPVKGKRSSRGVETDFSSMHNGAIGMNVRQERRGRLSELCQSTLALPVVTHMLLLRRQSIAGKGSFALWATASQQNSQQRLTLPAMRVRHIGKRGRAQRLTSTPARPLLVLLTIELSPKHTAPRVVEFMKGVRPGSSSRELRRNPRPLGPRDGRGRPLDRAGTAPDGPNWPRALLGAQTTHKIRLVRVALR